jgi:hypothetical protein
MYPLKPISKESLTLALERAWRYRMLNEPLEAESICRDILAVEPGHQDALVTLVLSLTDQFARTQSSAFDQAMTFVKRLTDEYSREYYAGIALERMAKAHFERGGLGSGALVHALLVDAMARFERSAELRPAGNDEALLRWNTCARLLNHHPEIAAMADERVHEMLE